MLCLHEYQSWRYWRTSLNKVLLNWYFPQHKLRAQGDALRNNEQIKKNMNLTNLWQREYSANITIYLYI